MLQLFTGNLDGTGAGQNLCAQLKRFLILTGFLLISLFRFFEQGLRLRLKLELGTSIVIFCMVYTLCIPKQNISAIDKCIIS